MTKATRRSLRTWSIVVALLVTALGPLVGSAPAAAEDPPPFIVMWGSEGSGNGEFATPWSIAVDGSGNVYVLDHTDGRVQKFSDEGGYLTQWGGVGSEPGAFSYARGIAADPATDAIYVVDTGNSRVQKFSPTGGFLTQWGGQGTGEGQFWYPAGVAVDGDGHVLVVDGQDRVQEFTSNGDFVTQWATHDAPSAAVPTGMAVDGEGNVYVVENSGPDPTPGSVQRVEKYTSSGAFLLEWGSYGSGNGQFDSPSAVAVDGDGRVFVADTEHHRIQEFTSTGAFVSTWGTQGFGPGQFYSPMGVATDGAGQVFVADTANDRIQVFGPPPRPDGRIRKGPTGVFKGDGVYNATGVGQTQRGSAVRGATVTYWVTAQNDAPFEDALHVRGTASDTRFKITYTALGTDVTAAVTAGTYTTLALGPGDSLLIKVTVKVRAAAPVGASRTGTVVIDSQHPPTASDTVRFVTSRA